MSEPVADGVGAEAGSAGARAGAEASGAAEVRDAVGRLLLAPHVLVALDYDGTLAPFADDPMSTVMVPGAAEVLAAIAGDRRFTLALVSGRRLADLFTLTRAPAGTLLAGSHGAERGSVDDAGLLVVEETTASPEESALLADLTGALEEAAAQAPGAWVEHKDFARVLHTRRATPEAGARATAAAVAGPATWPGVHPIVGKAVVELGVRATTKADAIAELRDAVGHDLGLDDGAVAVLFAGDDTTDEHALAVLGPRDLGIKVGDGATAAHLRVPDETGVVEALEVLLEA